MGFGGLHVGSLILILIIVILLFGTSRIRTLGKDIGEAIREFRKGLEGEKKDGTELKKEDALKQEKSEEEKPPQSPKQE